MAYIITKDCNACSLCEDECPNGCISEGDDIYVINAEECTDCGICVDACASDAIVPA